MRPIRSNCTIAARSIGKVLERARLSWVQVLRTKPELKLRKLTIAPADDVDDLCSHHVMQQLPVAFSIMMPHTMKFVFG